MEIMRVWKYYLDRARLEENKDRAFRNQADRFVLYAITNDKKKAKEFKETRNMDLFIEKKDDIDKHDYKEFILSRRGVLLLYVSLITKKDPKDVVNPNVLDDYVQDVTILMTEDEKLITESYSNTGEDIYRLPIMTTSEFNDVPCPNMFTSFFDGVMRLMMYQQQYKYTFGAGSSNPAYILDKHEDDYSPFALRFGGVEDFFFDELTMFIWNFGKYFK